MSRAYQAVPRKYIVLHYTTYYNEWYQASTELMLPPWCSKDDLLLAIYAAKMHIGDPDDITVERPSGFREFSEFVVKNLGNPVMKLIPAKGTP